MQAAVQTRRSPWIILLVLCLGFFMILLDLTIVNVAIPSIIDGLHAGLDEILWVLNAYILVYAVLLITAGRLGDMFGAKRLFLIGLAVFTLASIGCSLAQSPGQLIFARVIQGVGGAILTPQTLSILTNIFPPDRRGAAFGVWGAVAGIASVTGPTLGGFLVTNFSWQAVFWVNVPVGIVAFVLGIWLLPGIRLGREQNLDPVGVLLASGALFTVGNGLAAIVSFGMMGLFLPLTIFLQSVLGFSALKAGLTLAPMPLTSMLVAPFSGRATDRVGGKYILMFGLTCFAAGMGLVVWVASLNAGQSTFTLPLILAGIGLGCTFAPMTTVTMQRVNPRLAGAASGLLTTTRWPGAAFGRAVVGGILRTRLANELVSQAQAQAASLPGPFRLPFVQGFAKAAGGVLEVGRGQSGVPLPGGIPAAEATQVQRLAHDVFTQAFINAMRPSLVVPIAVLLFGALLAGAITGRRTASAQRQPVPAPAAS